MSNLERTFTLDDQGTDEAIDAVAHFLQDGDYRHDDAVRLRVGFDAMLMSWRAAGLDGRACTVRQEESLLRRAITVSVEGLTPELAVRLDSFDQSTDFFAQTSSSLGLAWKTRVSANVIRAEVPLPRRRMNENVALLIAAAAAVVAFLVLSTLPADLRLSVTKGLLTPIYDRIVGILTAIAGPYVFISLVCSTVGMGSINTLKSKGRTIVSHYLLVSLVAVAISMVAVVAFFGVQPSGGAASGNQVHEIVTILLGIIPVNIVDPFLQGNVLQIVILGVLLGIALLALGSSAEALVNIALELQAVVGWVFGVILRVMPAFVFLAVLQILDTFDPTQLGTLLQMLLAIAVSSVVYVILRIVVVKMRTGVELHALLAACAPGGILGLLTSSSAAAVPVIREKLREDLNVDPDLVDLAMPTGLVLHQPTGAQVYLCAVAFGAAFSGMVFAPSQLLVAFIVCYLLNLATPPVPGGALMVYAVMFAQMGLSADAVAIVAALNFLTDMIGTGTTMFAFPAEIYLISKLDEK